MQIRNPCHTFKRDKYLVTIIKIYNDEQSFQKFRLSKLASFILPYKKVSHKIAKVNGL